MATLRWMLAPAIIGGIFFAAAGRLDLPIVWGVLGVITLFSAAVSLVADPGMLCERRAPGPGNRDRLTRPVAAVLLLTHWVVAGLDVGRFQWTAIPQALQLAGLIGYAVTLTGLFWAMRANPFYSSVVRVQSDRGHRAITVGPYRFVRHPGYTFTAAGMIFGSLALGSWAGLLPVLGVVAMFVRRTALEDRLLVQELDGYADYARRVPYRLVAGVY